MPDRINSSKSLTSYKARASGLKNRGPLPSERHCLSVLNGMPVYSAAAPRAYEPAVIERSSCLSIHSPSHTEVARSQKLDRCRKSLNAREALMQLVQLDTLRFKDLESGIPITWAVLSRSTRRSTICCEKRAFRRSGIKRPAKVSTTRGALSAAVTSRRGLLRTRLAVGGRPVFRGRSPEGPSRHPLSIYYLYLSMWCEDRDAAGRDRGSVNRVSGIPGGQNPTR